MSDQDKTQTSVRRAAVVAGVGLLLLAVVAGFANFGVIQALVAPGDAATTTENILASEILFRLGVVGFILVAILDVIVAWALFIVFKPVGRELSRLAAWFRMLYAGILMVAAAQLAGVMSLLSDGANAAALANITSFQHIWNVGLILFALHLVLIGYLAFRSSYVPKFVGVVVFICGLGYLLDSFGNVLVENFSAPVTGFTFLGEVVLLIWLLGWGSRVKLPKNI